MIKTVDPKIPAVAADGTPGPVENDDHVAALLRLSTGARVLLEASRVAVGEQNAYGFEVHGTAGRLAWDFRRMGELQLSRGPAAQDQPVATVLVGPGAGEYAAFQPGAGIPMGYDDLKVIEAQRFLRSIETGQPHGATIWDAVRTAQAIINLALLTGNVGRPGTGANSITGQCNAMGTREAGFTASMQSARRQATASEMLSQ